MFLVFGLLALAAASAGIYGLVGYDVTQRTREFGVRIALGATSSSILQLVLRSGVRIVVSRACRRNHHLARCGTGDVVTAVRDVALRSGDSHDDSCRTVCRRADGEPGTGLASDAGRSGRRSPKRVDRFGSGTSELTALTRMTRMTRIEKNPIDGVTGRVASPVSARFDCFQIRVIRVKIVGSPVQTGLLRTRKK